MNKNLVVVSSPARVSKLLVNGQRSLSCDLSFLAALSSLAVSLTVLNWVRAELRRKSLSSRTCKLTWQLIFVAIVHYC